MNKISKCERLCTGQFYRFTVAGQPSCLESVSVSVSVSLSGPSPLRRAVWHLPPPPPDIERGVWRRGTFPPFREVENPQLSGKLPGFQTKYPGLLPSLPPPSRQGRGTAGGHRATYARGCGRSDLQRETRSGRERLPVPARESPVQPAIAG